VAFKGGWRRGEEKGGGASVHGTRGRRERGGPGGVDSTRGGRGSSARGVEEDGAGRCAWRMWADRGRKRKWVGPEETVKVLIYLNHFPTNSNYFDQTVDLPSSKIYK
jgi:hypothetical protein